MPRNNTKRKMDPGDEFSFFGKRSKTATTTNSTGREARGSRNRYASETFSNKKCIAWFKQYSSKTDPETIGPEGMERLCRDLGVDPENIALLVLAWKMGAKQMGYFTLEEWQKGLQELHCDSAEKLQSKLDHLCSLLQDSATFKSVYRYSYDFARDKDQRSLDIDTAKALMTLVLARRWNLLQPFIQFLDQSRYRVLNKDQWFNILEFSRAVDVDLKNYDVDGAWPVMLDEFVEWFRNQRQPQM